MTKNNMLSCVIETARLTANPMESLISYLHSIPVFVLFYICCEHIDRSGYNEPWKTVQDCFNIVYHNKDSFILYICNEIQNHNKTIEYTCIMNFMTNMLVISGGDSPNSVRDIYLRLNPVVQLMSLEDVLDGLYPKQYILGYLDTGSCTVKCIQFTRSFISQISIKNISNIPVGVFGNGLLNIGCEDAPRIFDNERRILWSFMHDQSVFVLVTGIIINPHENWNWLFVKPCEGSINELL